MTIKVLKDIVKFELVDNTEAETSGSAIENDTSRTENPPLLQTSAHPERPRALCGTSYKLEHFPDSLLIINHSQPSALATETPPRVCEILLHSSVAPSWLSTMIRMASRLLQYGDSGEQICKELKEAFQINSREDIGQSNALQPALDEILAVLLQHITHLNKN